MDETNISAEIEVSVRICAVECNARGHGELSVVKVSSGGADVSVIVEPCEMCIKDAFDEGAASHE